MERYFLLIFDGVSVEEKSFLLNYFGSMVINCEDSLFSATLIYRSTYVYFLNLKKRLEKLIEWKEVKETQYVMHLLTESDEYIDEDSEIENIFDSSLIAECINCLADKLPIPGTYVLDVIVGCNIFEKFSVSDNAHFAASLHRLAKWHLAHTSWLSPETECASNFNEWFDLTNCEAVDVKNASKLYLPFWRGTIEFKSPDISTKCFEGFELKIDPENKQLLSVLNYVLNLSSVSEYLVVQPVLNVIDVCCFSSIPQHLILPAAFELCVLGNSCFDGFMKLYRNIKESNDTAMILRLEYSILKGRPKSDKALNTNRWLKMISSGNVKYPGSCFSYVGKYLTLVVVPMANSCNMFAYIIRDSSKLDAQFYFNAVKVLNKQSFDLLRAGIKVKDYSVPFISKKIFLSSLQKTIGLHTTLEKSDTCEKNFPKDASDLLTTFLQCSDSTGLGNKFKNFIDVNATYYDIDPSDWVERINLLHRQILHDEENKQKRNVFMSFSPKRLQYHVSFSGEDIKKYFEPSGEAKDSKTSEPLQALGYSRIYNKDSLETVIEKKWPDILNCVYDDIYYNITKQSEDDESYGNEMVKCYVQHETASTCNNHQSQPEAPISIQAKSMTPRKIPKSNSKNETSFRQVIMNPDASVKKKFLKTAAGQSNHIISTIIKTLGVSIPPNAVPAQNIGTKRMPRKKSIPVRCSPRKKPSVDYYSSSRSLNSAKVQKTKVVEEKSASPLSEILKKKLRNSIASALESNGVNINDVIFKPCFKRLFTICQAFVKDIQCDPRKSGTSQYIQEIAEEHVKPVIKFERQKKKM